MSSKTFKMIVIAVCLMISHFSFAQNDGQNTEPVRFDGGVSILIVAGVAYVIMKGRERDIEK